MTETPETHPDMSAECAQLKTLTAMADDMEWAMDARGLSAPAQRQMRELRALLSAISTYAAKAYDNSLSGDA